jgi:hypothetical protein
MGPQPTSYHLGATARQHVDPSTGVGVDQHGRVVMASAQSEVIDPQHPRHSAIRQQDAHQDPHRGIPPDLDTDRWQQPGRGPAGQLAHDTADLFTESDSASLVSLDQTWYLFPEGLAGAFGYRATHPTYP